MENFKDITIDNHALGNVLDTDSPLVERELDILRDWQSLYRVRKRFREGDPSEWEALIKSDPKAASPYALRVRDADGLPRVAFDTEIPDVRRILTSIGRKGIKLIDDAIREGWPQRWALQLSLRPQIQELQNGNYRGAMLARLNSFSSPNKELFMGCFDTYEDPLGLGYSIQGWVIDRNEVQTQDHTRMVQDALVRTANSLDQEIDPRKARVITGAQIAAAGIAGEWNANTVPSEDQDRKEMGSLSFVFPNNLERNLESSLRSGLVRSAPELGQGRGWEDRLVRGLPINLIFHEGVGHVLASTTAGSGSELGEYYQAIKELESETLGLIAAEEALGRDINPQMKRTLILIALSWHLNQIEKYCSEKDPIKRAKQQPYARGGGWALNYFSLAGVIRTENTMDGKVTYLRDNDDFFAANRRFLWLIREKIAVQRFAPETMRLFDHVYGRNPINYLEKAENCPTPSTPAVAV